MKTLNTLIDDLHRVLEDGLQITEYDELTLGRRLGRIVARRLSESAASDRDFNLRLSKIGLPDRRLWYELNKKYEPVYSGGPEWKFRALYGDLVEELLLYLVERSGHTVADQQRKVEVDGVQGHIDCTIDGDLVDVKSASPYGFLKFVNGGLFKPGGDPFGYIAQLSAYNEALGKGDQSAWWLVLNKSTGEIALIELNEVEQINARDRVAEARIVENMNEEGPDKCYPLVPHGKSGNQSLSNNCFWCPFKADCYSKANEGRGLRTFQYSRGPVDFAEIVEEPRVKEITA